jgi:hypothetical protein
MIMACRDCDHAMLLMHVRGAKRCISESAHASCCSHATLLARSLPGRKYLTEPRTSAKAITIAPQNPKTPMISLLNLKE